MPNWDQEALIEEDRELGQRQALRYAFDGQLKAVAIEQERGIFTHYGNAYEPLTIHHPFSSQNSWIRAMPEGGASVLLMYRGDEAKPQIIGTLNRNVEDKIANYRKQTSLYRPLYPGEIDMLSTGQSEIFLSRRPTADVYGGVLRRWVDQDKMVVGDRAPVHHRQGFQYRSNTLGDEERFGLVTRPKENSDGTFSSWERNYPKVRDNYTAEHYQQLINPGNQEPEVLFRKQSGHVLNLRGFPISHSRTGNALRHVEEYFANDDSSTKVEIDEAGNYALSLGTGANVGLDITVPVGGFTRVVELDEKASIRGDQTYQIQGNSLFQVGETLRFNIGSTFELRSRALGQTLQFGEVDGGVKTSLTTGAGQAFIIDDTEGDESINLFHASGANFIIDSDGSVKTLSKDGGFFYLNANSKSASLTSGTGSYLSMADSVSLVSSQQAITMDGTSTLQMQSNQNILMTAPKLDIQAGAIALGALASFSATLAEPLALLFDAHIHASPVGPTSPPLPPNTAALYNANPATSFASAYIKMKGNLV